MNISCRQEMQFHFQFRLRSLSIPHSFFGFSESTGAQNRFWYLQLSESAKHIANSTLVWALCPCYMFLDWLKCWFYLLILFFLFKILYLLSLFEATMWYAYTCTITLMSQTYRAKYLYSPYMFQCANEYIYFTLEIHKTNQFYVTDSSACERRHKYNDVAIVVCMQYAIFRYGSINTRFIESKNKIKNEHIHKMSGRNSSQRYVWEEIVWKFKRRKKWKNWSVWLFLSTRPKSKQNSCIIVDSTKSNQANVLILEYESSYVEKRDNFPFHLWVTSLEHWLLSIKR